MIPLIHLGRAVALLTLFVIVDASLRVLGFDKTWSWVDALSSRRRRRPRPKAVQPTTSALRMATALYLRTRRDCLPKSLAAFCYLRLRGIDATLNLGVKLFPFAGHAWVVCEEQFIDDSMGQIGRYTVIRTL